MSKKPSTAVLERAEARAAEALSARVARPRGDVFDVPAGQQRQLPVWQHRLSGGHRPAWFFVQAHGGAGTSLLSRLTWEDARFLAKARDESGAQTYPNPAYGMDARGALPNPRLEPTGAVVVVCRTHLAGLTRARELAAQYLTGAVPAGLQILGLITIADQPGRLPKPLASAQRSLEGVYAHTWSIPYVPEYRLYTGSPSDPPPATHPAVAETFEAIRGLVTPKGPTS